MSDNTALRQRLMRMAREVGGLDWADRKALGEAIGLIDTISNLDARTPLASHAGAEPLTDSEIRQWWASENGLEDCDMCKVDDFTAVVRAVESKIAALKTAPTAAPGDAG